MRLFDIGIGKLAGAARFLVPAVGGLIPLRRTALSTGTRIARPYRPSTFAIIKIEVNFGGK